MDRTKITAGKVTINFIDYVAGSLFAAGELYKTRARRQNIAKFRFFLSCQL